MVLADVEEVLVKIIHLHMNAGFKIAQILPISMTMKAIAGVDGLLLTMPSLEVVVVIVAVVYLIFLEGTDITIMTGPLVIFIITTIATTIITITINAIITTISNTIIARTTINAVYTTIFKTKENLTVTRLHLPLQPFTTMTMQMTVLKSNEKRRRRNASLDIHRTAEAVHLYDIVVTTVDFITVAYDFHGKVVIAVAVDQ